MQIYLDNQATTKLDEKVLAHMLPFMQNIYGNASSQHFFGREAMKGIDNARLQVAKALNAKPNEIYFTSSGSEANNWAIKGIAQKNKDKGNHIIISSVEHPSLKQSALSLKESGFDVTVLGVDKYGFVCPKEFESAITDKTILASIIFGNNEIGTIQNIEQLSLICKSKGVLFHTDAVQAVGSVEIDVAKLKVDLLSLSAHKFYGPKGVGALFIRNGVKIEKLISGGEQERALRAGTYNTAGIVGLGKAIEIATCAESFEMNLKIMELKNYFIKCVIEKIPEVILNGPTDMDKRLCGNASFSFKYIEGESLLLSLDIENIAVSSGSACSSGSLEPSYVLLSTGLAIEFAHGTIRFSFGKYNSLEEADIVLEKLIKIVERLRSFSPLYIK